MKPTLNKIREYSPCASGWQKLLTYLGKTKADDEPLSIATILNSNDLDDALWCLRAVEGRDREIRLFSVWCARKVQHLLKDQRSLAALDVAERFANGQATDDELNAARDAASAAAWDADAAARASAWANARASAWAAAWAAAWVAADAARSAADAARSAAYAAGSAAGSAATGDEMRAKQEAELRRICEEG